MLLTNHLLKILSKHPLSPADSLQIIDRYINTRTRRSVNGLRILKPGLFVNAVSILLRAVVTKNTARAVNYTWGHEARSSQCCAIQRMPVSER